jgi:DNA-binding NtrC family response regulator
MIKTVLVVDDDKNTREGLKLALEPEGYNVLLAAEAQKALEILRGEDVDLMLTDLRMPGIDGLKLTQLTRKISQKTQVIILTAYGTVETAVEAMQQGAYNYLTKPVNLDNLKMLVEQALSARDMASENVALKERLTKQYGFEKIIGNSREIISIFETVRQVAPTRANILVTGDSGTGKELIANALHNLSGRADKPFMAVHCASIAKTLLESELFGHERGAFTGAVSSKRGKFERADGGTLFLDEISETDLDIQVKLLRFLEQWEFERVGGTKLIKVDVRLVAATNKNLKEMVEKGSFRDDLYYRLNVVTIHIPPLRERRGDVTLLANNFVREIAETNKKTIPAIAPEAMAALEAYHWPGNVRELRNCIESIVVMLRENEQITLEKVPVNIRNSAETAAPLVTSASAGAAPKHSILLSPGTSLQDAERLLIEETLRDNNYNVSQAARILNISRRTLHRKINEYNIKN